VECVSLLARSVVGACWKLRQDRDGLPRRLYHGGDASCSVVGATGLLACPTTTMARRSVLSTARHGPI